MYCSKCGLEIQNSVAFCSSCGSKTVSRQNSKYLEPCDDNQISISAPEVAAAESNAVASLVLGIISIVAGFLLGIILGSIAISKGKQARRVLDDSNHNFWIALSGVITGTVGIVLSIILTILWICCIIIFFKMVTSFGTFFQ